MKSTSLLSLLLFLFLQTTTFGQSSDTSIATKIDVASLQEDFNLLRGELEDKQTGMYQYTSKQKMDKLFDAFYKKIDRPMTAIAFFRLVSPILKPLGNGHTEINCPKAYQDATQKFLPRLPLNFYYDKGALYITQNLSDTEDIPIPSKLLGINGKNATTLFHKIKDQLTRDGYNETLPILVASKYFSLYYAYFIGTPESFDLSITDIDGSEKRIVLKALTLDELRKNRKKRYGDPPKSFWADSSLPASTLKIEDKIATMKLNTFDSKTAKKRGQPFKSWLDDSFAKINAAGVTDLILDLRGNGGGDPMPTVELFSHLHDQPFTFYREVSANSKKFKNGNFYDFPMWLLNLRALIKLKKKGDRYVVKNLDGTNEQKPAKDIYKGTLYVLTDPNSYSATGEMTAILKEHNRGIFVGEEPGGNPNQNTSGIMLPMVLPHSKLRVTVPVILFEMNVNFENTGYGVKPDHSVRPSVEAFIAKEDVVMDYVLNLIKTK